MGKRGPKVKPIEERFWRHVVFPTTEDSCWIWSGAKANGYGRINDRGQNVYAHRLSWEMHNKKLLREREIIHTCDNRFCVNPDHMLAGNRLENVHDAIDKGIKTGGKIKQSEVSLIKSMHSYGMKQNKIANIFGVCNSYISQILNGKRRTLRYKYFSGTDSV